MVISQPRVSIPVKDIPKTQNGMRSLAPALAQMETMSQVAPRPAFHPMHVRIHIPVIRGIT